MSKQTDKYINNKEFSLALQHDVNYSNKLIANLFSANECLERLTDEYPDIYDKLGTTSILSNTCSITIDDLDKKELLKIKYLFGLTGEGKKSITTYSASMIYTCELFEKPVDIIFRWNKPETCEVSYETEYIELNQDNYIVSNGKVTEKRTKAVIECKEPFMESLFKSEAE